MGFIYMKISEYILDEIIELFVENFNSEPWNDKWKRKQLLKDYILWFTQKIFWD